MMFAKQQFTQPGLISHQVKKGKLMKQENLSVLAYANGFTLWHYKDTDTLLNVTASTFFVPVYNILNVGDMVMVNAGTDAAETAVAFITAISSTSVTLSTISQ